VRLGHLWPLSRWFITETGIDDLTCAQTKKRLGSGRAAPVSFYRPRLEGTLVPGTDGLFNYIPMEKLAEVVRGRAPSDAQKDYARSCGCRPGSTRTTSGWSSSRHSGDGHRATTRAASSRSRV